jgi:FkbM family methyltransferase
VLELDAVERVVATLLRATIVRESVRFAVRELAGAAGIRRYRLRGTGLFVFIRHRTPDVATLDEVFYQRQYEPPPALLSSLPQRINVVDLGANIGLFGLFALGRLGSVRLTAIEPDPANTALLFATRDANELDWAIVQAAAAASEGTVPFASGGFSLSRVERGPEHPEVAAVDAFHYLAGADLAKVDIEGSEWEILGDARLATDGPRALVLEYHPYLAPGPDAAAAARHLLLEAGYEIGPSRPTAENHGVVWAWRP